MSTDRDWTIREALDWMAGDLARRGVDTARLDAELLLADAIGTTRMGIYLAHERLLTTAERTALRTRLERRRAGEPVAYILGRKEFYGLDFFVDSRVLVPRPETEFVVDAILEAVPEHGVGGKVLELGTGSGAIAIAVARARPTLEIDAVDSSADALAVARLNAHRHGAIRVRFLEGDLWDPVPAGALYDVVASNPPYVPSDVVVQLPRAVRDFEPHLALDGGPDGLAIMRRLVFGAPARLAPEGTLVVEVGAGQADLVVGLVEEASAFERPRVRRDYAGIDRVVTAVLRGSTRRE